MLLAENQWNILLGKSLPQQIDLVGTELRSWGSQYLFSVEEHRRELINAKYARREGSIIYNHHWYCRSPAQPAQFLLFAHMQMAGNKSRQIKTPCFPQYSLLHSLFHSLNGKCIWLHDIINYITHNKKNHNFNGIFLCWSSTLVLTR